MESYWDACLQKSPHHLVFLTFDFIKTEWEHVGWEHDEEKRQVPFVLVVKEDDEILALFPLVKEKTRFYGFPVTCVRPLSHIHVDRSDAIIVKNPQRAITAFYEYFCRQDMSWNILMFKNILAESDMMHYADSVPPTMKIEVMNGNDSPYIQKDISWSDYLKNRSKNYHKRLKNKFNRIKKDKGNVFTREYRTQDETSYALQKAFEIDLKSWKGENGTALSSTQKTKGYWEALTNYLAGKQRVRIWLLWTDDTPIAFEYHVVYNKTFYSLKWSFDKKYQQYSPGLLLKFFSMEAFWKEDVTEIDLLGNSDSFKEDWAENKRSHCNLYIFNSGFYSRAVYFTIFMFRRAMAAYRRVVKGHGLIGDVKKLTAD